jgi:hypothetical protein
MSTENCLFYDAARETRIIWKNLVIMRILTCSIAVLMLLSCSQGEKSKELAALDKAYRSGVLTLSEYQTKKAAVEATEAKLAAIEKAHADGVLTNDEYVAKKSALLAANDALPASTAVQPVVTSSPPTATPKSASADGHSYRMKMVKVMDAQGFASPIVSATMLMPIDWQSQGATTWNIKDKCNTIQTSLRATGPDGRAFEVFPAYNWSWADDPSFLRQIAVQQARLGAHACDVAPPVGAADYLKKNLGKIRPNATLTAIEPAPKLMQMLQDRARQNEQAAAQYRLQKRIRPDVVRARLKYNLNGRSVEEWIIVATIIDGTAGLKGGYSYNCLATMVGERAPQGQLEASEKLFELINSTYRVDPVWQGRVTQNALAMQKIQLKGVQDRAKIVSKNADDIRNIQRQGYENQQKGQDQSAAQFSQYLRGTETYQNPATGEKVDLDSKYGNAWVNNRGEYLLSDQAGFDPNTVSQESWTAMQHAKP